MLDALIQFALFLAEAIVIIAAILIVMAGIAAIIGKVKMREKTTLNIRKLNQYYQDLTETINDTVLTKKEQKKLEKEKKELTKKKDKVQQPKKRMFIINFKGDVKASQVNLLREEITAILTTAKPLDEVVLRLESTGGMMHAYGLAASQLQRIKDQAIPLTVCIDKVAASGGYLMACVADKILAAPFSIIGSIGVIAQLPNFNRWLKKKDIDFEQISAGEYKRTLSLFAENTRSGRKKAQEEVDESHQLFKSFVQQHRSQLDIDKVATGEHWFATQAIELKLVDELMTSDDYLLKASKETDLYEVTFKIFKKLPERMAGSARTMFGKIFSFAREQTNDTFFV